MPIISPETALKRKIIASKVAISLTTDGTIGSRIDALNQLREDKRALEEKIKIIEGSYHELEEALMEDLKTQGMDKATGKKASVSVSSTVVGNLVDDKAFFAYVKRTGYFHLLQRRLSDPAIRELLESKGSIPGVEPFVKKRLNLRTL
jgi:hypothetical protein